LGHSEELEAMGIEKRGSAGVEIATEVVERVGQDWNRHQVQLGVLELEVESEEGDDWRSTC
jgi:hypothetical protein